MGQPKTQLGELTATRGFPDGLPAAADLSNVIPFARARRTGAEPYTPHVIVTPADRPAPPLPGTRPWVQVVLVVCSLIVHGGLFYAFWQEPKPLPGIGGEAVAVELVIGDNRQVGPVLGPGKSQDDQEKAENLKPDEKPVDVEQVTETREVKPEETRREVAREQPVEPPKEQDPEQRQVIATVETPQAEIPTALPRETPPDMQAVITVTREQPKEVKPVNPKRKKAEQESQETKAGGGMGLRSISSQANYNGRVFVHLQRFRRYPAAARSKGLTGKLGTVAFVIDGSGRVTSVSVTAGTGVATLDQEMTAMVRRASPFPAPPDGEPRKFNALVNFDLVD